MAFRIDLYNFSKKENSTKRPSLESATSFNCKLKKPSGILNPAIELNIGLSSSPAGYNYAYIPNFNRYYWIEEWINDGPLWTATLKVDVLATYKTEIGQANLYVLRASNEFDTNIIDTYYTSKTNAQTSRSTFTKPHDYHTQLGKDGYIVGLISKQPALLSDLGAQYGSLTYVYFTRKGLRDLVRYLMNTNNWAGPNGFGFDLDDCSLELQKSLVDPLQYIKSCLWVPYTLPMSVIGSDLDFYGWTVPNIEHVILSNTSIIDTESVTVNITKHPNTSTRGNYINVSPYTKIWLTASPYGVIELDTTITANITSITLEEHLDLISGKAILNIIGGGVIMEKVEATLGVPIQLSQVSRDYLGMASGIAKSIAGGVEAGIGGALMSMSGGMFGGDSLASGLSGAIGGAVDSYKASIPKAHSLTGGGGFVDVSETWAINYQFFRQTADDNAHVGRPLYDNRVISSLGGFCLVKDGSIPLESTLNESLEVKKYLESGFFYE